MLSLFERFFRLSSICGPTGSVLWVDSKLQKINIKPIQAVLLFVVVLRDKFAGLCQPCLGGFSVCRRPGGSICTLQERC